MSYFSKSYYIGLDSYHLGKLSFLILQLFSLVFMQYSYKFGFALLNISSLLYFIFHMFHNEKLISNYQANVTKKHELRVKVYRILLLLYIIYTVWMIVRIIFIQNELSVLWWVAAVSIMLYSEAITISSVIAFGKNVYISGDYYIPYNAINKICEEKSMNSVSGEIILLTLWNDDKKLGFDKMFIDEYHELRLRIYQC